MNDDFLKDTEENLFDDLVSFIENEEKKEIDFEREGSPDKYLVYNDRSANYYLGKIKELNKEINKIKKIADEETTRATERISTWKEQKIKPLQGYLDYIHAGLEDYLRREFDASEGKMKKIKLSNGEVKFVKQQNKYIYDEEELMMHFLNNAKLTEKFIEFKPQLNKNDIKAAGTIVGDKLFIDNEAVLGVKVVSQEDKVTIKTV